MLNQLGFIVFQSTRIIQIILFLAGCYYFGVSVFGWFKRKETSGEEVPPFKKFAIVVAAHNEEAVIGHIIDSLQKLRYPDTLYRIFIIADNCNDKTAEISLSKGVTVCERFDEEKKGKGYALEWMFNKLYVMKYNFNAVCVFDADNLVSPNFLLEMNRQLCSGHMVIQGYIDSKNPFDSWISCSYSIAFWLSNRIFQLPRYYLGLSCGLCGTGFCVDINLLKQIGWGATCLTEDLEFTMKLALNNHKVVWSHRAVVYDEKPITLKQSWHQRKRWMQGHADCAGRFLGPLFVKAFKESNLLAFDCGIYLFQPVRFIFLGLTTIMIWVQTFFPESPFYNFQYIFPSYVWYILITLQFIYGPLVVLAEKKFNLQVMLGFLFYPFYCLTWLPIAVQGFMDRSSKNWCHTLHTRGISIDEIEEV